MPEHFFLSSLAYFAKTESLRAEGGALAQWYPLREGFLLEDFGVF
jgi:hypothetical protein